MDGLFRIRQPRAETGPGIVGKPPQQSVPAIIFPRLVIEAKNSYWLDFVYHNFRDMLGASYKMWMKKQAEGDPEKMKDWSLSQNIPLSVYLLIDGEWVFQDYYNTVGPMAFKKEGSMAAPIVPRALVFRNCRLFIVSVA